MYKCLLISSCFGLEKNLNPNDKQLFCLFFFAFAFLRTNTPVKHNALLSHAILFWVQKTVCVSPIYQLLYLVSLVPMVDQVILHINIYLGAHEATAGVCEEDI